MQHKPHYILKGLTSRRQKQATGMHQSLDEDPSVTINTITQLESKVRMLTKQNEQLMQINKYLENSLNKRMAIIEKERLFYTSQKQTQSTSQLFHRQSSLTKRQSTRIIASNNRPLFLGDEQIKISQLLDLDTPDEVAIETYNNDSTLRFLKQLDEDTFIELVEEQNMQKILQIYEHVHKLVVTHRDLFHVILKLKRITLNSHNHKVQRATINTLSEATNNVIEETRELMNCDRVTCYIVDESKGEIWSKVAQGSTVTTRMPIDKGIAGYVAGRKECVNIQNAGIDLRFNPEFDSINGYKTQTILAAPIINENNSCLGVLQCVNKKDGIFTNEDIAYLKIISCLSLTTLNQGLNQNQIEYAQNKLRQILKYYLAILTTNDTNTIIKQTETLLKYIMNTDQAKLVIQDKDNQVHMISEGQYIVVSAITGLFKMTIDTQTIQSIVNCSGSPQYDPAIDLNTTMPVICYPITKQAAFMVQNVKGISKKQSQYSSNAYISGIEKEMLDYIHSILVIKLQ